MAGNIVQMRETLQKQSGVHDAGVLSLDSDNGYVCYQPRQIGQLMVETRQRFSLPSLWQYRLILCRRNHTGPHTSITRMQTRMTNATAAPETSCSDSEKKTSSNGFQSSKSSLTGCKSFTFQFYNYLEGRLAYNEAKSRILIPISQTEQRI